MNQAVTRPNFETIAGSLIGLAIGDAFAAPVEFLSYNDILGRYPIDGPADLIGNPARVTDDTQMSLAVGFALSNLKMAGAWRTDEIESALRREFIAWLNSPENNRAPGMTCLQACERLERGMKWTQATVANSKGCGANMRVAPVGLLPDGLNGLDQTTRAALAQFQAALTHGHPTALAASDLTAVAVHQLASGEEAKTLVSALEDYAASQREVYHFDWLEDLWQCPGVASPEAFIRRGWDECAAALEKLKRALAAPDYEIDPCLLTGAGWIAEEALATALYCFLLYADEPMRAVKRAAVTSGDSDSIACLAGAFAGARCGLASWRADWVERIEYHDELLQLAKDFSSN
jgi:ADP-ribosylglycohydrolase